MGRAQRQGAVRGGDAIVRSILRSLGWAALAAGTLSAAETEIETALEVKPAEALDGKPGVTRTFSFKSTETKEKSKDLFPAKEHLFPAEAPWKILEESPAAFRAEAVFPGAADVRDYRRKLLATAAESGQKLVLKKSEETFGTLYSYEETFRDTIHTREAMEVFKRHWNKGTFEAQKALEEAFGKEFQLEAWNKYVKEDLTPAVVGFADTAIGNGWWIRKDLERDWGAAMTAAGLKAEALGPFPPYWPAELLDGKTLFPRFYGLLARKESWTQTEKKAAEEGMRARFQETLQKTRAALMKELEAKLADPKQHASVEGDAGKLFGCYYDASGWKYRFRNRVRLPGSLARTTGTVGESGAATWEFGAKDLWSGYKMEAVSLAMPPEQRKIWAKVFEMPESRVEAAAAVVAGVISDPEFYDAKPMRKLLAECLKQKSLTPLEDAAVGGDSSAAKLVELIAEKQAGAKQ